MYRKVFKIWLSVFNSKNPLPISKYCYRTINFHLCYHKVECIYSEFGEWILHNIVIRTYLIWCIMCVTQKKTLLSNSYIIFFIYQNYFSWIFVTKKGIDFVEHFFFTIKKFSNWHKFLPFFLIYWIIEKPKKSNFFIFY